MRTIRSHARRTHPLDSGTAGAPCADEPRMAGQRAWSTGTPVERGRDAGAIRVPTATEWPADRMRPETAHAAPRLYV